MIKRALIGAALLLLYGANAHAKMQNKTPHSLGGSISVGAAEYKGSSKDGDGVVAVYGFYRYQLMPELALEAGIKTGMEADDWDCDRINDHRYECNQNNELLFNLNANQLDYENYALSIRGQYPLSERNSLFVRIGGHFYDYEIAKSGVKVASQDGIGLISQAGWQYQWDSGVAMQVSYEYTGMGDLETFTLSSGIAYRF